MPNLDGSQFTKRFRELPGCGEVPVVVLTVYDERSYRLRALEAGATDFLHSPVDHSEFATRVRNLLKLRKQQILLQSRATSLEKELLHSEQSREMALRDSHERLGQIIDTVPAMISATDKRGRCIFINAFLAEAHGVESTEIAGKSAGGMFGTTRARRHRELDQMIFDGHEAPAPFEEEFVDVHGSERVLLTTKSPLRDLAGQIVGVLTSSTDITERKIAERHLLYLAQHDTLTNLPNRMLLTERVRAEAAAVRSKGDFFALHFLDLDGFKGINDVLGHSIGDRLLKEVGERIRATIRPGDMVARLGGDEFAIVQTGLFDASDAAEFGHKLIDVVAKTVIIDSAEINATASVGIAISPADGLDADELLKSADLAMYRAKADGGRTVRFFSADLHTKAQEMSRLDARLRRAVEQEEFVLHYQPQISVKTGRIVGAEALIRWRHEDGTLGQPGEFLPRAEENGLIIPMNEWALHEACRQAKAWQEAGLPIRRMAVNLSPVQFRRQNMCDLITGVLDQSGLDPANLELEITESIVMENTDALLGDFQKLRDLGVRFAIDDFGTGYSSFKYIKSYPITRLKIDKSFIQNMDRNSSDYAIVHAIIGLCKNLELAVLAEGVETEAQMRRLRNEGCDEVQGFHFSRPLPAEVFAELLRADQKVAQIA
jgi:diguanylate cyclase (GGDEF)-like protein/PAS domain S-box-containing protein